MPGGDFSKTLRYPIKCQRARLLVTIASASAVMVTVPSVTLKSPVIAVTELPVAERVNVPRVAAVVPTTRTSASVVDVKAPRVWLRLAAAIASASE